MWRYVQFYVRYILLIWIAFFLDRVAFFLIVYAFDDYFALTILF